MMLCWKCGCKPCEEDICCIRVDRYRGDLTCDGGGFRVGLSYGHMPSFFSHFLTIIIFHLTLPSYDLNLTPSVEGWEF